MRPPGPAPSRTGAILFGLLALLTVGAFYLTQHLKVLDPLVNGGPRSDPPVIDPRLAGTCLDLTGRPASFRSTRLGFYLQAHADTVIVRVDDADGNHVATMSGSGRHLPRGDSHHYQTFRWDGRLDDGRLAPAGTYTFFVALVHENRAFTLPNVSVQVLERRPRPRVTGVRVGTATSPYLVPGRGTVTARISTGGPARAATLLVLRDTGSGPEREVVRVPVDPRGHTASWDGRLAGGRPAPAGTYRLGLEVTDAACTTGRVPVDTGPAAPSTPGVGVEVTELSATPPPTPLPAGSLATVGVVSGGAPVRWSLHRGTSNRTIFTGRDPSGGPIQVRLRGVGLYRLTLTSGAHTTAVPLVASATGARAAAPVLVVLPALSWQGANPTSDGDGRIDTLGTGPIGLNRPFVGGLPSDYADEAALLAFLDARHLPYDVTTDVALAAGTGPALASRHGVLLDGAFTWLPAALTAPLNAFAAEGGGVFSDGFDALSFTAPIHAGVAGPAQRVATDPFGVRRGTVLATQGQLLTPLSDGLGLFDDTPALRYPRFEALIPPSGRVLTVAGIASSAPAILGFHLGRGTVVEAAVPGFGASLTAQPAAGSLLARIWHTVLR